MKENPCRFGFRVVGAATEPRRLIDHAAAFRAHAECDTRTELHRECYLSAFQFGDDFAAWLARCGTLEPSTAFNSQCRRLAERLATQAGTPIDDGAFDKVRLFRAPNSRHPKTERH